MSSTQTALELAQTELSDSMVPWPDDFMTDYTPQAGLLFGRQVAMCLLKMVTDAAASVATGPDEEEPTVSEVLNGVSMAIAGLTHALVALEVLPAEAEEGMLSVEPPN
jgi:hypothetical protein